MSKGTAVADEEPGYAPGTGHRPVLAERCLELFAPAVEDRAGAVFVDATVGAGGHATAMLQAHPDMTLVGLDRDARALEAARRRLAPYDTRTHLVHATYDRLPGVLSWLGLDRVHAVLFDLGVSSLQLDTEQRGFSYARDAPLDMRMDTGTALTAAEVVNTYPAGQLARVLRRYGQERFARRIAEAIVTERRRHPFDTSARLVDVIYRAVPAAARRRGGHPAKRTFQALRIEVNAELDLLGDALPAALDALVVGGRVAVLAYHSLEDRLAKRVLTGLATSRTPPDLPVELPGHGPQLRMLTRGAETATEPEIETNPRAASVRLRAAERVAEPPDAHGSRATEAGRR